MSRAPRRRLVRVGEIVVRRQVGGVGSSLAARPAYRCSVFAWRRVDAVAGNGGVWSPAERARLAEMMGRVG